MLNSDPERQRVAYATLALMSAQTSATPTTADLAAHVGFSSKAVSQIAPDDDALFKLLHSQIQQDTAYLGVEALDAEAPLDQLARLAEKTLTYAEAHPGFVALLVLQQTHPALARLQARVLSQHLSMVEAIIDASQTTACFDSRRPAHRIATGFLATLYGRLSTPAHLQAPVSEWLHDWADGVHGHGLPSAPAPPTADGITAFDVRALLSKGEDPLREILRRLGEINPGGVLQLTVPFQPAPLLTLLRRKGHLVKLHPVGPSLFGVTVVVGGAPAIIDLRDLEPPEPMQRALEAVESIVKGDTLVFVARLARFPRLLVPQLERRSVCWQVHELEDQTTLLWLGAKPTR